MASVWDRRNAAQSGLASRRRAGAIPARSRISHTLVPTHTRETVRATRSSLQPSCCTSGGQRPWGGEGTGHLCPHHRTAQTLGGKDSALGDYRGS